VRDLDAIAIEHARVAPRRSRLRCVMRDDDDEAMMW
jgi:hypothetical protein